jgi:hypothetical protein
MPSPKALAAAAAAIPATLALLLAGADPTWAQGDCQTAFERWALLSSAQVRPSKDGSGRGGCVPSEAARRSLLDALARARGLCGDSSDESQQPTRTLISINQSFISALSVCRTSAAEKDDDGGDGWSVKTAPTPEKPAPKLAAPLPPPTPPPVSAPVTGGPRPSVISPKPVVVAPPVAPPKADTAAPKTPCLEVSPAGGAIFAVVNRRCKGHTVLAVVETRATTGETACKGYSIGVGVNLRGAATPRINYECVASLGGCNKERLGDMFPECDW